MSITYKTIGFNPKLIPEILADRKKATVRLKSEMKHSIHIGDTVFLIDSYQKKPFALAEITSVENKRFDEFDESEKNDAQIPELYKDFLSGMEKYYSVQLTPETTWSLIRFRITDDGQKRELIQILDDVSTEEEK